MNLVEFNNVSLGYSGKVILKNLNFVFPIGKAIGIAGPNGSGKTTILKAILGLLPPIDGQIIYPSLHFKGKIGYVPQRGNLDELFPFTLWEIIEMGGSKQIFPWQNLTHKLETQVKEALSAVNLQNQSQIPFRDLSGGQKQRALLARALVSNPEVLILDEPTYGLDVAQSQILLELFDRLCREKGISLIMVSHNLIELFTNTDLIFLLHQGNLAFSGPGSELTDELLGKIYGIPVRLRENIGRSLNG
ncbi:MAG: metal ABC transporter ATP-binding protein [Candidatus Riflebacteria bacterium]|nr:metal ABC transporter ATP-binding protein [Candidatus Riflebacteria bacterium]